MGITLSNAMASAACNAYIAEIDADASPAYAIVYAGASPLMTITLDDPSFGSEVNGVAIAESLPLQGVATASGVATRFEIFDGGDTYCCEGTVGGTLEETTGDMQLNSSTLVVDDIVVITALILTAPKL